MNSATRRSLLAVAAQQAQNHPADVRDPLAQGTARYRKHLWAIHGAIIVLATVLLGAGLLAGQIADSQHENTPPTIELPPKGPVPEGPVPEDPVPEDPVPEDPVPEDPVPEDPVPEDPVPARINLDPPTLTMVPGELLPVQALGTYEDGSEEPIPALELSWRVNGGDEELLAPDVASVDSAGNVTANRPGQATLTASTQGVEESADIIVTDNPGDPGGFQGPGNLENPNSTPPTTTAPPNPVVG